MKNVLNHLFFVFFLGKRTYSASVPALRILVSNSFKDLDIITWEFQIFKNPCCCHEYISAVAKTKHIYTDGNTFCAAIF